MTHASEAGLDEAASRLVVLPLGRDLPRAQAVLLVESDDFRSEAVVRSSHGVSGGLRPTAPARFHDEHP